ncbi:MAG: protein kinase [Deltaproteobacteria bacterium]|nr:protein kinase [Deltaproteobacteria bacterium]
MKRGFKTWLKLKLAGTKKRRNPVDSRFLADLSDIETVGRYEIIGKLGQGSMGVVFLGRDPYIDRRVGIKVSRPAADVKMEEAAKYRERFFLEAQSAGRLVHPGIVAIYDAGMHKDFYYITMEYVDGPSLQKHCSKDNLLPLSKVVEIIFKVCHALDFAHKQNIVHRDIKPSNLLLGKTGEVKITDFGIAQVKTEQSGSKGIIGSPSYMSPEQVKEGPIEDKSDIFSLGCVLYELLTGVKAFTGENYFSIMYKITNEEPTPIPEIRSEVPEILWKITKKALAKAPAERYQSCMDLAYDLSVALRGLKGGPSTDKIDTIIDYVHGVPFFENFSKEQVKEILSASNIIKVRRRKVLMSEGEIDDTFYIILSGKVAVNKGQKTMAVLSRGECFGEMSYLSGRSRAATVVAGTDCILMKISGTLLDKSAETIQILFLRNFALALIERLSRKKEEND